ncbi:MAG: OsmC family protein [Mucinivorans sp.]
MDSITIDYKQDMNFEAEIKNQKIMLDAAVENGGHDNGVTPKPLMLVALAGCTGMDVASLAKKMRVPIDRLEISVSAEKSDTQPVVYTSVALRYNFMAVSENQTKIRKIVDLSMERYCGVAAMIRMICPLSYSVWLGDQQI